MEEDEKFQLDEVVVAPWINQTEWNTVCAWLYAQSMSDKEKGVARVAAWRARGNLPFFVESTSSLCKCIIRQESCHGQVVGTLQDTVRLMMGMAITRFINGLHEYGVQQGDRGSIVSVVSKFNIPDWLVGLRHDSTHRQLPSLAVLKQGTQFCYQWLYANYWKLKYNSQQTSPGQDNNNKKQLEETPNGEVFYTPLSDNMIRVKLSEFRCDPSSPKSKSVFKTIANALFDDFVILLKERLFLNPIKYADFQVDNVSKDDLTSLPTLSCSMYSYWCPLLNRMIQYKSSVKTTIITAIITVMHNSTIDRNWVAILGGWLRVFLSVDDNSLSTSKVEGSVEWQKVFDVLKANPGYYSHPLMTICVKHMSSVLSQSSICSILSVSSLVTISQRNGYDSLPLPLATPPDYENDEDNLVFIMEGDRMEIADEVQNEDQDWIKNQDENEDQNENENLDENEDQKGNHYKNKDEIEIEDYSENENQTEDHNDTPTKQITGTKDADDISTQDNSPWIKTTNNWYSIPLGCINNECLDSTSLLVQPSNETTDDA